MGYYSSLRYLKCLREFKEFENQAKILLIILNYFIYYNKEKYLLSNKE